MGRLSDEDIERVRQASDLVQIASERIVLKQAGRKFKACCPFHQEKTPSFQIDPELGLWHCFGCGEGGDVFDFVQKLDNVDFRDAVQMLADRANIELSESNERGPRMTRGHRERIKDCCDEAARFFNHQLMRSAAKGAAEARTYLASRGFGGEVCRRWDLGYAPGAGSLRAHLASQGFTEQEMVDANLVFLNDSGRPRDRFHDRVMFPIRDKLGRTIAFGGRVIGKGEPKYLNSSETPVFQKRANLFAIDRAKDSITSEGYAIVVEGYTDVIALHEAGVTNVVATLGTALTQTHLKLLRSLRPEKVVYLFDGDSAGQKAADRASEFIDWNITMESGTSYIDFLVTVLPDNLDPAEFVAREGRKGVLEAIGHAVPLVRFAIDRRLAAWDLSRPEQRTLALSSAVSLLVPIKGSLLAEDYVNYIADRLNCSPSTAATALASATASTPASAREAGIAPTPADGAETTPRGTETETERAERECLSLIAHHPDAVQILQRTEGRMAWQSEKAARVAALFIESYHRGMGARELVDAAEKGLEGAALYLSAGTIECDDEAKVSATVIALLSDLKENNLLSQIREGNARLRHPEGMSAEEYDEMFEKISTLQKDLNNLRAARTGQDRP